ncbi:MAG: hypothetical protein ACREPI_13430, partial [Candidatus Dormibacterales bacterium]
VEPQFAEIVSRVSLAPNVAEWTRAALKQSFEQEQAYHGDEVGEINARLAEIRNNMHVSYDDRLAGRISMEFWADRNSAWQKEEARLTERLAHHNKADSRYMDLGVEILNQAERIETLYAKTDEPGPRRDLLATLLDTCTMKEGRITPAFRPAWAAIAEMAAEKTPLPTLEQMRRGYKPSRQPLSATGGGKSSRTADSSSKSPKSASYQIAIWGG